MPHRILNPDGDTITYARISEEERAQLKYSSTEAQLDDLRRWAQEQGWVVHTERWDEGYSATKMERPELIEILTHDVENKNLRRVCIIEIGRLGGGVEWIPVMDRLRNKHGIEVLAHHDPVDASTPGGEFCLTLLLAAKRFQVRLTGQRIKDKIHSRAEKGLWHGGMCPPYFHVDREATNLVPDMQYADVVLRIHDEYRRSESFVAVADWLTSHRVPEPRGKTAWDWHQVERIIKSPYYAGLIEHDGRLYPAAFEAMVPREIWEESQQIVKKKKGRRMLVCEHRVNLLIGLGRCGHPGCGAALTCGGSWKNGRRFYWYLCSRKQRNYKQVDHSNRIRADKLEDWVISQLVFLSENPKMIQAGLEKQLEAANQKQAPQRETLRRLTLADKKVEEEKSRVVDSIATGSMTGALLSAVNDKFAMLEQEQNQLQSQIDTLKQQIDHSAYDSFDPEDFSAHLGDWSALMEAATPEEKRELLKECVRSISHDREIGNQLELFSEIAEVRTTEHTWRAWRDLNARPRGP